MRARVWLLGVIVMGLASSAPARKSPLPLPPTEILLTYTQSGCSASLVTDDQGTQRWYGRVWMAYPGGRWSRLAAVRDRGDGKKVSDDCFEWIHEIRLAAAAEHRHWHPEDVLEMTGAMLFAAGQEGSVPTVSPGLKAEGFR